MAEEESTRIPIQTEEFSSDAQTRRVVQRAL